MPWSVLYWQYASLSTAHSGRGTIVILLQVRLVGLVSVLEGLISNYYCLDFLLALLTGYTLFLIVQVNMMCAANESWLLIYKQKLPDKQQGWIIYKVAVWKVAFHTSSHVKCHMNSKQAKQFSGKQKYKIKHHKGKSGSILL